MVLLRSLLQVCFKNTEMAKIQRSQISTRSQWPTFAFIVKIGHLFPKLGESVVWLSEVGTFHQQSTQGQPRTARFSTTQLSTNMPSSMLVLESWANLVRYGLTRFKNTDNLSSVANTWVVSALTIFKHVKCTKKYWNSSNAIGFENTMYHRNTLPQKSKLLKVL